MMKGKIVIESSKDKLGFVKNGWVSKKSTLTNIRHW